MSHITDTIVQELHVEFESIDRAATLAAAAETRRIIGANYTGLATLLPVAQVDNLFAVRAERGSYVAG